MQEQTNKAKLTVSDVRLARAMYEQGYRIKFILKKMPTNISYRSLQAVLYRDTWKWVK